MARLTRPFSNQVMHQEFNTAYWLLVQPANPHMYGAVGDGDYHPLSEKFNTLAEAKAVYPFVTDLTQSLDWAAFQLAENESRGKRAVTVPLHNVYHFHKDTLILGEQSVWISEDVTPQFDKPSTTIKGTVREGVRFGDDALVKVMSAADAGSSDEFTRTCVFRGFKLTYDLPRRSPTKGTGRIGLHLNTCIKHDINVTVEDCEYGVFGYSCWGGTGIIRIDSCHKGIFFDPRLKTYENNSTRGTNTSFNYRVEIDHTPFGISISECFYARFQGWVEGANIGMTNYDHVNETAVAISAVNCDSIEAFIGIEAWQGYHVLAIGSSVKFFGHFAQQTNIDNSTGKQGAWASYASLTGETEKAPIPEGYTSLWGAKGNSHITIEGMTGSFDSGVYATSPLVNKDAGAMVTFINTGLYVGALRNLANNHQGIEIIGDRWLVQCLVPADAYTYMGHGRCKHKTWQNGTIGDNGQVTLNAPAGWKIEDFTCHVITGSSSQNTDAAVSVVSITDTQVVLQTSKNSAWGTKYKLELSITK